MKMEQNLGQPPVPKNGKPEPLSGRAISRFDLPSPETIAAYTRPEPSKPEQLFYDIKQTAFALNMCTKTVRRIIARGKLTPCKVVRKVLIPKAQIEAFIKATCDQPNFQ